MDHPLCDGCLPFTGTETSNWLIYWLSRSSTKTVHSGSEQVMTSFPPVSVQEGGIQPLWRSFRCGRDHILVFLEKKWYKNVCEWQSFSLYNFIIFHYILVLNFSFLFLFFISISMLCYSLYPITFFIFYFFTLLFEGGSNKQDSNST